MKGEVRLANKNRRRFKLNTITGVIYNLDNGCQMGNSIKSGNYQDFYTYDEAVMVMTHRGKDIRRCRKCKWPE